MKRFFQVGSIMTFLAALLFTSSPAQASTTTHAANVEIVFNADAVNPFSVLYYYGTKGWLPGCPASVCGRWIAYSNGSMKFQTATNEKFLTGGGTRTYYIPAPCLYATYSAEGWLGTLLYEHNVTLSAIGCQHAELHFVSAKLYAP